MYDVHDWAAVHFLYEREHLTKTAIAKRLGMSRRLEAQITTGQRP